MKDYIYHRILNVPYKLYVRLDRGPKQAKQTIVFLHGIGATGGMWQDTISQLPSNYHIITLDLLGFGFSAKPKWSKYNAKQHAAALKRTLRLLDIHSNVVLVGHSLGALVALEYAYKHKRAVKRVILCSPPFYQPPRTLKRTLKDDAYRRLYQYARKNPQALLKINQLFKEYLKRFKHTDLTPETLPAYIKSLEACIENQDSMRTIQKVTVPTGIVYGLFDVFLIKKNLRDIKASNTSVTLHPIQTGHEITKNYSKKLVKLIKSN